MAIEEIKDNRTYVIPNGFRVSYYYGEQVIDEFINVGDNDHITICLDKGLFIVSTETDTKFVCHAKDLIAMRY